MFTIDTSVWVSAVSPKEPFHGKSRAFLDYMFINRVAMILPTLLTVEIAAALGRRQAPVTGLLEMTNFLRILGDIRWVNLDKEFATFAANLASRYCLRSGDAIFAAVALQSGSKLISLDDDHIKRLAGIVGVLTPDQALQTLSKGAP